MTGSDASGDSVIGVTVRLTSLERCAEPIRSPAWCSDAEIERANGYCIGYQARSVPGGTLVRS